MAGVSNTFCFLSHFATPKWRRRSIRYTLFSFPSWHPKMTGLPKWQVYQIHLVFYFISAPQNGRWIRYTLFSIPFCHPKMATPQYQIHSVFFPFLAPQDDRPSKMATVSDTPGFLFHLGTPKWQVYQIHLVFPTWPVDQIHPVFYPILAHQIRYICFFLNAILATQNGRCIR